MSSLLQHHGGRSADGRGVELICYKVRKGADWEKYCGPDSYNPSPHSTTFTDSVEYVEVTDKSGNKRKVEQLYRFYRRPVGMWGCWVVFRYNGRDNAPDLSVPIQVFELPKGAEKLTVAECAAHWFS